MRGDAQRQRGDGPLHESADGGAGEDVIGDEQGELQRGVDVTSSVGCDPAGLEGLVPERQESALLAVADVNPFRRRRAGSARRFTTLAVAPRVETHSGPKHPARPNVNQSHGAWFVARSAAGTPVA
jgi:hypothetical protein